MSSKGYAFSSNEAELHEALRVTNDQHFRECRAKISDLGETEVPGVAGRGKSCHGMYLAEHRQLVAEGV